MMPIYANSFVVFCHILFNRAICSYKYLTNLYYLGKFLNTLNHLNQDKQFLLKGTVYNAFGIIPKIIAPLLLIILARYFSQEEFGMFAAIKTLVMTLSRVAIFGLDKGLLWFIPQNQKHNRPNHYNMLESWYFSSLIALGITIASVALVQYGILDSFEGTKNIPKDFVIICLLSLVPMIGLYCFSAALEGLRKPQYKIFINQFFVESLGPILAIITFYFLSSHNSLVIGYTVSNFIGLFIYLFIIQRFFKFKWSTSIIPDSKLFKYSIPIGFAEIIGSLILRVDLWMIFALLGPKYTAVYAIMVTITNGVKTIRQSYDPLIIPIVSKMTKEDRQENLKKVYSYAVNMITSIQLVIAFAVLYFPKEIMSIAGKDYTIESQALVILLLGNLINGYLSLNGQVIVGMGRSFFIMVVNFFALLINIGLNYVLIQKYGFTGAAIATITSQLIQNLVFYYYQVKLNHFHLYERHLIVNALIIGIFSLLAFLGFDAISQNSLLIRVGYFGITLIQLAIIFFAKRKTYTLK